MTGRPQILARLDSPRVLGYLLITPAAIILLGLLAYPLLLGVWLSLTSATIGKAGEFIGLQNYATIFADPIFRGAAGYSLLYTICAEFGKLVLGGMLLTLMIPPTVLLLPAYLTVRDIPILHLNLLNTPWAI